MPTNSTYLTEIAEDRLPPDVDAGAPALCEPARLAHEASLQTAAANLVVVELRELKREIKSLVVAVKQCAHEFGMTGIHLIGIEREIKQLKNNLREGVIAAKPYDALEDHLQSKAAQVGALKDRDDEEYDT